MVPLVLSSLEAKVDRTQVTFRKPSPDYYYNFLILHIDAM